MPRDLDFLDKLRTCRDRTWVRCVRCDDWFSYLPAGTYKKPPTHCPRCFAFWRARQAAKAQRARSTD